MIPSDGAQKIKEKKETSNLINQARASGDTGSRSVTLNCINAPSRDFLSRGLVVIERRRGAKSICVNWVSNEAHRERNKSNKAAN